MDIIFIGWYHLLDKTIYTYKKDTIGIGPKEHSFFITFLFHGINVWKIVRFLMLKFYSTTVPLYVGLMIATAVFFTGYLFFYKRRTENLVKIDMTGFQIFLTVAGALIYVIISVYGMLKVSDYIRSVNF